MINKRQEIILPQLFDKIFYVNVDKHIERNANFRNQFHNEFLETNFIERIDAIKPGNSEDILHQDNLFLLNKIATNINNGVKNHWSHLIQRQSIEMRHLYEICCSMSHAKTIKSAIEVWKTSNKKQSSFLILEDDSRINFSNLRHSDMLNLNSEDYDLCYGGSTIFHNDLSGWLTEREYHVDCSLNPLNHDKLLNADSGFFGTFGYMIKINNQNIHKFEALVDELNSGVIADFCLSSQQYLVKKSVHKFFIDVANEKSTINQSANYSAVNTSVNPDIFKLGFVKNYVSTDHNKIEHHPFSKRFEHAKQTWFFMKNKDSKQFNKICIDSSDISSINSMIKHIKNSKLKETAYILRYDNLMRPWFATKEYLVKASTWTKNLPF